MNDVNKIFDVMRKEIVTVIATLFLVVGSAFYFGVKQYSVYQAKKGAKEKQIQELLITQQKALKEANQEIDILKQPATRYIGSPADILKNKAQTQAVSKTNAEIIKKVKPAVVYIETEDGSSAGSGMIIESAGFILTNAHVVQGVNSAKIKLSDNKSFVATVIGRDENIDLAILKVDGGDLPTVELGNSDTAEQGDEVFTLGYPFGLEGDVSFKEGTISRRISDGSTTYLETSAEIHPGNSGGPLVNRLGKVIGINTAIFGKSIKGIIFGESIKLAIPINSAKNVIPELKLGKIIIGNQLQPETKKVLSEEDAREQRISAVITRARSLLSDIDSTVKILYTNIEWVKLIINQLNAYNYLSGKADNAKIKELNDYWVKDANGTIKALNDELRPLVLNAVSRDFVSDIYHPLGSTESDLYRQEAVVKTYWTNAINKNDEFTSFSKDLSERIKVWLQ
ncbi:MAG: trypsin-like peptidase domain-containing protein [bacterium]|nr:trypsin-like peptidase domain-containing protein [bacterium]